MRITRFVILTWLVAWSPSAVLAQPLVQIRTRSVIRPDPPNESDPTVLGGTLVDETDEPIANEVIAVVVAPAGDMTEQRTDRAGHFDVTSFTARAGEATVRFEGTAHIDPSELSLGQPSSALIIEPADGEVDLDRDVFALSVMLRAPRERSVAVVDERGQELVRGRLEPNRPQSFLVETSRLPPPGTGLLRFVEADPLGGLSATLGVRSVTRFRSTVVDANPEVVSGRHVVRGTVRDHADRGLAGQIVSLVGDSPVSTATTSESGAFVLQLPPQAATATGRAFFVQHESHAPWWKAGRSPSFEFPPRAAAYPPGWWLLALSGLAVLAALALGRSVPADDASSVRARTRAKLGGRSQARADLRYRVAARIISASSGSAIAGTRVLASEQGGTLPTQVALTDQGAFELPARARGAVRLEITADGHEPYVADIEIPHDGRWYGATIALISLRDAALRHYERALRNPDHRRASHTTPREVLARHARNEGDPAHKPLAELTLAFERAYYAPHSPTAEDVAAISSMADAFTLPPNHTG